MKKPEKIDSMTDNDKFYLLKNHAAKFPAQVLRARGFRLYLSNGQRLVDLWLNGGAAILGHTPPNLLREIKNTASRGLYAPYPHFTENRLIKALTKLFPGRVFRLYAAPPQELINNSIDFQLWRPFIDPNSPFKVEKSPLIIPVIPGIQTWVNGMPLGLCIITSESEELLSQLPPGDLLSPVLMAAAARGIYDLLAAPQRGKPHLPRVFKALKNSKWQRQGVYLKWSLEPHITPQEWETLFVKFLEAGFLLPPLPSHPLILPGELSDGEDAKLAVTMKI
ncbi:MAG: hypothetical protein FWC22_06870 [Treponema sp.]|nr:hypothetical protein [Treponema sp.]